MAWQQLVLDPHHRGMIGMHLFGHRGMVPVTIMVRSRLTAIAARPAKRFHP